MPWILPPARAGGGAKHTRGGWVRRPARRIIAISLSAAASRRYNCACMIRALLLLFDSSRTWEAIKNDRHTVVRLSLSFLLPWLLLTCLGEALGLMRLGVERGEVTERLVKIPG